MTFEFLFLDCPATVLFENWGRDDYVYNYVTITYTITYSFVCLASILPHLICLHNWLDVQGACEPVTLALSYTPTTTWWPWHGWM